MKNALIQFKQPLFVYKEYFNTVQIAHACLRRIFQCGRVYLHFTYNDIYICYSSISDVWEGSEYASDTDASDASIIVISKI